MKILFLLFTLFALLPAWAAKQKKKEAGFSLTKLQEAYKKNASLEADFLQEVFQASLQRTKTSKGHLQLSKPNLARWEIDEPERSVMVSNGHKLSYYTPDARGKDKGQVIERTASELEKQPLFRILTGQSPLNKEFKVEKNSAIDAPEGSEKWTELVLKPAKKMGDVASVELKVDSKYLIRELITESETGNKTKITLQNQVLGAKLPPALFEFKAPADTEVLKN
jgi:outer membrane lipoprotein carrier protein